MSQGHKIEGKIVSVSISEKKGEKKKNVPSARLVADFGIEGDVHAGAKVRQVSMLAVESIDKMRRRGLDVNPGDFAENITTRGIDLPHLSVGTRFHVGDDAVLEISQIGKECHARCDIYYRAGDCVMPTEGVFTRVLKGGTIKPGDKICIG